MTQATQILTNLGIWHELHMPGSRQPAWLLKPSFKSNLMLGIFKSDVNSGPSSGADQATASSLRMQSVSDQSSDAKFIEKLDNYSLERWEVGHSRPFS
jgi:hypothetical protein